MYDEVVVGRLGWGGGEAGGWRVGLFSTVIDLVVHMEPR
jgi:hypothetical protein